MSVAVPPEALPSRKLRQTILWTLGLFAALWLLFYSMDLGLASFEVDAHFLVDLAQQMFPPNIQLYWTKDKLFASLIQTLAMAFVSTVWGGGIALVLAFFAASNTSPNRALRLVVRTLLAVKRSVPQLIVILVLVLAVGIGPFSAVLALTISTIGMFGKFFADTIEQTDKHIAEAVDSLGSTRMQSIRFAVLPQVLPSFVANLFYAFDVNLRAAIPLGIFSGAGLGFELAFANGLLHYRDVLAYTILIVLMITVMERISDWLRRAIITQPMITAK
jgi:phosphonate transport system permease protein